MKKYTYILVGFMCWLPTCIIKAQLQNYKITYRHCFQSDTTRQLTDTVGQEAILIGNRNYSSYNFSKYFGVRSANRDLAKEFNDVFKQKQSGHIKIGGGIYSDSVGNIVFKNKLYDSIYVRERLMEEYILTTEKSPQINWSILQEYKQINQLKCQKAVCTFRGRSYTAWFTNQIAIVDGPWKFSNLPGLVLDIYDSQNQVKIYAVAVEFPSKEAVPAFQAIGRKIDFPEYYNYKTMYLEKENRVMDAVILSQPNLIEGWRPQIRKLKALLYCIEKWAD